MVERRLVDEPVVVDRRRGRPPLDEPRSVVVKIRLTLTQRQRLCSIASLNGLNQTAFIRQAIDEAVSDCSDDPLFR
jgi:hypothetical protein